MPAGGAINEARDARRPFVSMGVNTCQFLGSVDDSGGWCSYHPTSAQQSFESSSFDTSFTALARGYVLSRDGHWIYLYEAAQAQTHGGPHVGTVVNASGVALLALRRDVRGYRCSLNRDTETYFAS